MSTTHKESELESSEQRPSTMNPDPAAVSTLKNTGVVTRSAASSARIAASTARQQNSASTSEGTTESTATAYTTSTNATEEEESEKTIKPPKRTKSRHSDSRKKKLLELQGKEKIAQLKLEEIRASLALAQLELDKQRAAAAATDEQEAPSASEEEEEDSSRVQEWLERQPQNTPEEEQKITDDGNVKGRGQGAHTDQDREHREDLRETRPARQPQNVDVTSLAAALTQAVRMTRDAPKYLQELPIFNGQCSSWLAFRAAYYETEALFSKTENVSRLRRSVRGAALEAISSLLISQPDPGTVMEALERRFGRPDALAMNEMQKIKALGKLSDSPRDLCIFANKVSNIVATIEALKKVHYLYNPELVKIVIDKLTPIIRSKWYDYAARSKEDIPDLKRITAFLNEEADKCGAYAQPEDIAATIPPERTSRKKFEHTFATNDNKKECPVCRQEHQLPDCKRFQENDVNERWEIAKKHRICFRCLRSTHRRGTCKAKKCGQDDCAMAHHRLLHHRRQRRTSSPPLTQTAEEVSSAVEIVKNADCIRSRQAFLKIAPITVTGQNGTRVDTYALMDDGSTITLIDEGLAEILDLDGPRDQMWVQGLNETVKHENSKRVDIKVRGRYSGEEYTMRNARTVQRLMFTKQNIERRDLQDCAHLQDIEDDLVYKDASPKILIGQDNWELLVALEIRTGRQNQPVASRTRLGWVLHGYRTSYQKPVAFCGHTVITREESMEQMMKKFFDLEALGIEPKKQRNDPEERALKILQEKSRRLTDGRFETALLWKEDKKEIPNNYEDAYKRLKSLEKKLDRDRDLKIKYEERINNLFASGYAAPAPTPAPQGKTWYLPHFAVCNPAKPKIRLVHDAAARSHGRSLNDMLLSGPDLLQSLPGVIMRFRQHPFAISADIQEMFMQIKIREEDRDALRFLWRGDNRGDTKPQEYQMTSVIFGATSSPCTALYIKNRNAEDFEDKFPRAVREIKKNHYMDDYITSFPSQEEAIEVSKDVDHIHRQAGFILRGWVSNQQSVTKHFNADTKTAAIPIGGTDVEKTLGLLWEVKEDCISFHLNEKKTPPEVLHGQRPPTKREALSVVMSLFDPLGLVSPLTTPAKRLMQETWRYGTGWDEPIPQELLPRWVTWLNDLRNIRRLQIPRCYSTESSIVERELHTFVDASEEAYSTAIYIRMRRVDGSVHVALAAAKSRVAPLKPTSIPRLELQAALLGARLARTTEDEHDFEFAKKTYWSDSRTVLSWIRAEPRAYKTFVAHRLAEIEELTKVNEWRWVPTKENVADDATRETPDNFDSQHRWFRGPDFLWGSEEEWPTEEKTTAERTGEERCHAAFAPKTHEYLPNIESIARWQILVRATGRVLQFIDMCRVKKYAVTAAKRKRTKGNVQKDPAWNSSSNKVTGNQKVVLQKKPTEEKKFVCLDASYLLRAEKMWIMKVQDDSYANEKIRIMHGSAASAKDRLATLRVYIGDDGLIRLRGRIAAAPDIHQETINPAILDGQHKYTRMYIQHVHEKMHHGGVELIVNEIRQRFWVTRIRPTVKGVIRSCLKCKLRKAKPISPATGDLPPARVTHHTRPFSYTGLDYFGPIEVTVGRHREKRWVALFTCMTIRAIHLEIVNSLSADSAIAALRRFIARRGQPTELWSDNATCFKAADKELKEAQEVWDATKEEANARHIRWRYIPPASPFMGGAWERLVRSVKEALRVTLHEKHPSDETLHTLLVEVENVVNSRPLTYVSVAPEEPEALTPNHILLGPNCHVPAPGSFTEKDQSARQLWRRAQQLADEFWRRWVKEYLPLLQHRREPHTSGTPPKIGDLVIICDPNLPRNVWPKGRVTGVYPGSDNEIRVVDIRTSNGHVLRRPTKKIVVLPVDSQTATAGELCTTTT